MNTPRPTPETDAEIGVGYMVDGKACYIDLIHPDFARKLERERDEAREELQQWKMLCLWGGTPEHIDQFIKGQQSRIHEAQEIELVCEQLERERDEAREDAMNYYAKIGELERERDEARQELSALKAALRQRLEETK